LDTRLDTGRPCELLLLAGSGRTCRNTSYRFVLVLGTSEAIIGRRVDRVSSVEVLGLTDDESSVVCLEVCDICSESGLGMSRDNPRTEGGSINCTPR
jgi:hypothetical protein